MRIRRPGKGEEPNPAAFFGASEDAGQLANAAAERVDGAVGVEWYGRGGSAVDLAAWTLCRLRRARAGERGGATFGDEAVRAALERATPEAVVWIASRAISYMDESGFPDAVEAFLTDEGARS